jgi:hypothetical protein
VYRNFSVVPAAMLASQTFKQLSHGPQYRTSRIQLVVPHAVSTSLRVPCHVDLEQLGRAEGQEFPLNTHGVGKAGEVILSFLTDISRRMQAVQL